MSIESTKVYGTTPNKKMLNILGTILQIFIKGARFESTIALWRNTTGPEPIKVFFVKFGIFQIKST
jgi:hypothetical protein